MTASQTGTSLFSRRGQEGQFWHWSMCLSLKSGFSCDVCRPGACTQMCAALVQFQSKCNGNKSGEQERGRVKEDWVGYYGVRSEFPAEGRRLRWHKWGKRGSHSCSLISVMETHPFCQGLQKILGWDGTPSSPRPAPPRRLTRRRREWAAGRR